MEDLEYSKLESLCAGFQRQWVAALRDTLKKHEVPTEIARSICGDFSFDLSMILDQGAIEHEGTSYRPLIAFDDESGTDGSLVVDPLGPEFHEFAYGTTEEAYE